MPIEIIILVVCLGSFVVSGLVLVILLKMLQKTSPRRKVPVRGRTYKRYNRDEHVAPGSKQYLFGLLYGDKDQAYRLVDINRFRYPDRPEQWCWDKAIQDLIRDRTRGG